MNVKDLTSNWTAEINTDYILQLDTEKEIALTLTKANFEQCLRLPWGGLVDAAKVTLWEGADDGNIDIDYRPTPKKAVETLRQAFKIEDDEDFYPCVTLTVTYDNPDNGKRVFKTYAFEL